MFYGSCFLVISNSQAEDPYPTYTETVAYFCRRAGDWPNSVVVVFFSVQIT